MRVELLFWEGCPSHRKALAELCEAMVDVALDPSMVVVREVETDSDAALERFVGSPTIRVDGVDVQPPGEEPVGLTCRVYQRRDGRISPTPDPADVRDALLAARTVTDVFVLDNSGVLRYRGAPDADHDDPAQNAAFLRGALDALLDGRDPNPVETPPVGCSIKWKT